MFIYMLIVLAIIAYVTALLCIKYERVRKQAKEWRDALLLIVGTALLPILCTLDLVLDWLNPHIDRRLERRMTKKAQMVWHDDHELRLIGHARRVLRKHQKVIGTVRLMQIPHTDTWYVLNNDREIVRERDKQLENVYHLFMDRVGAEQLAADYLHKLAAPTIEGNGSTALFGSYWRAQRYQASDGRHYPEFILVWPGTNEAIGSVRFAVALSGCMVEYQASNSRFQTSPQNTTTIDELSLTLNDAVHEIERQLTSFDTKVPLGTSAPGAL